MMFYVETKQAGLSTVQVTSAQEGQIKL